MKKIVFIVVFMGNFCFTNAQEIKSKKGEVYLPQAGDLAISFNAEGIFKYLGNAFNGNLENEAPSVSTVVNNAFVGKFFITDKSAYRVLANIGYNSYEQPNGNLDDNEISEVKFTQFNLTLGFGKEWRRGTTRLQGFYGADALITANSGSIKITSKNIETGNVIESAESKSDIGFGAGIQGFIGAEYFIFPKFSLGAQYTYRVGFDFGGDITYTFMEENEEPVTFEFGKFSAYSLGSLGVTSINLTLHF